MHRKRMAVLIVLLIAACSSGDDGGSEGDQPSSGAITDDQMNRYELDAVGTITFTHTGGLICSVEDGELVLDFAIDAGDGDYEYGAVFPGFEPAANGFQGEFTLTYKGDSSSVGPMNLSFGYGPAPEEYPGVVRAAGTFAGPVTGGPGNAEIAGSYACFLMDSEVGN